MEPERCREASKTDYDFLGTPWPWTFRFLFKLDLLFQGSRGSMAFMAGATVGLGVGTLINTLTGLLQ